MLLDGEFGVNIISKSLKKKLGLRKSQPNSFVIWMANQQKVQPMELIQNLKIDMVSCVYKISVIVLKMENGVEAYSMLLRRPWLKQAKVRHNWGDSTLIIISKNKIVMFSTIKHVNIKLSQRPKNLDNEFNWEEGLSKQEEEQLYKEIPKLWPIREVVLEKLHFLLEIDCGMI